MAKKITITLSDKAEKFFNEVMYSLEGCNEKPCTQTEAINWCLEALQDFEVNSGQDLISYLQQTFDIFTETPTRS